MMNLLYAEDNSSSTSETYSIFSFVPQKTKGKDEKKWFYELGGFYLKKSGNSDSITSNYSTILKYNDNISESVISYSGFYGVNNGVVNDNKGKGIVKFDHFFIGRIEFFIFSQSDYNTVSKLFFRENCGGGIKFIAVQNIYLKTDISAAPVYQAEKYDTRSWNFHPRWSYRLRIIVHPVEWTQINIVAFYIPDFTNYRSYRTEIDLSAKIALTTLINAKIGYLNDYNRNAIPGTSRKDVNLYGQLSLKL